MKLAGKIALITGGSRGIGKEIARVFLEEGAKVMITSKDPKRLESAANELGASFVEADIQKENEVKNVVKNTIEKFGKIDILVNNAGIFPQTKPLHEISESEWNEVIDVNLTGQFRFTKAVIPHMKKNGGGSIVNISSNAGLKAFEDFQADAYTASKGALVLLTKTCAVEYAKDKIRFNCICPGVVETDMTKPYLSTEADRKMMESEHPIGKIGMPIDVAKAVLYFASDDSSWTTGSVLAIDGGGSAK